MNRKKLKQIKDQYNSFFRSVYSRIKVEELPKKYQDFENNFKRLVDPVLKAYNDGYRVGLDFGCGIGGCCVAGHMMGLKMTGIDIPEAEGKPSPYVPLQKELQSRGYSIILSDTNKYPWDFKDDQFDFIVLYFSLNKEFMHSELDFELRLNELLRITRKGGAWYIWPTMHFKLMKRKRKDGSFDKEGKIKIVFGV